MGFAGELATIGLSEVFQNVVFNRLTGVLTITDRDRHAAVLVSEGRIRAFSYGPDRPFDYAVIAERSGAVPSEVIQGLRKRRRRTLKATLKKTHGFDEKAFDGGVQAAIEEELILLFSWRNARFEFEEGRAKDSVFDPEQLDCSISIDPQAISMEAARRQDEWEAISRSVGSEKEIFLAAEGIDPALLPTDCAALLPRSWSAWRAASRSIRRWSIAARCRCSRRRWDPTIGSTAACSCATPSGFLTRCRSRCSRCCRRCQTLRV